MNRNDIPILSSTLAIVAIAIFLAFCSMAFILQGCAGMQGLDTPEKKFLGARGELNILLEQYIMIQDDVPIEQHLKIKGYFENADLVLDMWESNLGKDIDFAHDYRAWITIKSQILQMLKEIYDE